MPENFNDLTPAETERLVLLAEEASEVIQIISKILRHGYSSHHPDNPNITNRELLEEEIGHMSYAHRLMLRNDDINHEFIVQARDAKELRVAHFLHHQDVTSITHKEM